MKKMQRMYELKKKSYENNRGKSKTIRARLQFSVK